MTAIDDVYNNIIQESKKKIQLMITKEIDYL